MNAVDHKVERVDPNPLVCGELPLGGRPRPRRRDERRSDVQTRGLRSSRATSIRIRVTAIWIRATAIWILAIVFLPLPLRAHDIYTSWTDACVRSDRLELTLTLARASATRLIPNSNALPPITPENFADYAPRLRAAAAGLFEITSAGKPLKLTSSEVKISGDADITFHLVYPRPPAGLLRFVAHYLFRLVDGHVGTLVVNDAAGKDLGWSPVSVDQPMFEVRAPPKSDLKP